MMSLSYAMMGLLTYGPMNGYNLKKIFDKSIAHVWAASLSQIYRELSTLEKKGYVTSIIQKQEEGPDKRIYSITDPGRDSFQDWLRNFPEQTSFYQRDEFMLRIFFGSRLEKKEIIKEFEKFITQKIDHIKTLNETKKTLNIYSSEFNVKSAEKEELFWKFTIKQGKMSLQSMIKWAEECIKELEELN